VRGGLQFTQDWQESDEGRLQGVEASEQKLHMTQPLAC
jgi:hypothetical protein